jgi:cytochrome P450
VATPAEALPVADGVGLPWDVAVDDAVGAIADARARLGDSFVVRSGGDSHLFTFSMTGVESFYALAEDTACKGLADYLMLRRKLPDEVFTGRRVLPGSLFRRDDVADYLTNLDHALDATEAELGERGSIELFSMTRRLGHRMGLASWAAPGCAEGEVFERLVVAFDALDGADAFVHPDLMAAVSATGKRAERAALDEIVGLMRDAGPDCGGLFGRIRAAWSDAPADERARGVALDVALIHVASMSNLMAALGWALVDLLEHPDTRDHVDDDAFATSCALESIRMAQRSIMSRAVLSPVAFDVGPVVVDVPAGWTISTLLPLLNTSAAPGLDAWDPGRWTRHRLGDTRDLASPMLVTAFGHGRHSCPAQPFALAAMTAAMTYLLGRFDMTPRWRAHPRPVPRQIGGVARAADPCVVEYARR